MIEAVKTTASAGEIWAIVIVAVVCLAFWLSAVAWADMHPIVRGRQVPEAAPGQAWLPAQRTGEADRAERSVTGPAGQGRDET